MSMASIAARPAATRRRFLVGSLALLGSQALLAACGGGPPVLDPLAPVTIGRQGGARLQLWSAAGGSNLAVGQAVAAYARSHPTSAVQVSITEGWDQLEAASAAGTPPDVYVDRAERLIQGAARGLFSRLDGDLARDHVDVGQYYHGAQAAMRWRDATYGLPAQVAVGSLYQDDLTLNGLGLDPTQAPATWDDLARLNREVRAATGPGRTRAGFVPTWGGWPGDTVGWLQANGVPILDPGGTRAAFATPAAAEALAWVAGQLRGLGDAGWLATYQKPYRGGAADALAAHQLAMGLLGVGDIPAILANPADSQLSQWPLPGGPGAAGETFGYFTATLLLLPTGSRQHAAAWDYSAFQSGPEGQAFVQSAAGSAAIAAIPAIANDPHRLTEQPWRARANALMGLARTPAFLPSPAGLAVHAALDEAAAPLWAGGGEVAATLANLQQAAQAALDTPSP